MASPAPSAQKQAGRGGKKRSAKYLAHASSKRKKELELHAGLQGFLITCDGGRERQSCREAIALIERFYAKLHEQGSTEKHDLIPTSVSKTEVQDIVCNKPPANSNGSDLDRGDGVVEKTNVGDSPEANAEDKTSEKTDVDEPPQSTGKGSNIDALLEQEIDELRDNNQAQFASLETGCSGIVFIRMLKEEDGKANAKGPNQVVEEIMQECAKFRKPLTRFCLRFLPVEMTCYASADEVRNAAKPFLLQHFPSGEKVQALKFAVVYEARANTSLDRMEIINAVAKLVEQPHSVDLKNPDKTIVVQIVKTICTIGVVTKYKEYAKYNLRQLTSPIVET